MKSSELGACWEQALSKHMGSGAKGHLRLQTVLRATPWSRCLSVRARIWNHCRAALGCPRAASHARYSTLVHCAR